MSRDNPPKLHHRPSNGTAYICYRGKQIYMGKWGSEADRNYKSWLSGWLAHNKRGVETTHEKYTVPMLIAEFLDHFQSRPNHSKQDYGKFVALAKRVCKIFPETYVDEFGPKSLKYLRDDFVHNGYFREIIRDGKKISEHRMFSRKYINTMIGFMRHIFKWGVSEELVENTTYVALMTVGPLYEGDTDTIEAKPRETVSDHDFDVVVQHLQQIYQEIAQIMRLTAMRPNEVVRMTVEDIKTDTDVWLYIPKTHKTKSRGKQRLSSALNTKIRLLFPEK